jgi:hypothetical protein
MNGGDDNDFLFEGPSRSIEDPWAGGKDTDPRRLASLTNTTRRNRLLFVGALIVIPYILIVVLFSLVSSNHGTKNVRLPVPIIVCMGLYW